MAKSVRESGQFVLPGDRLGVVEEFMPGSGTYDSMGTIYSGVTGYTLLDKLNKVISIRPAGKSPVLPKEGAIVVGMVTFVQEKMAQVSILKIDDRLIQPPFSGLLHISSSSPNYERRMGDVCKSGDMIRAKVTTLTSRVPLLTTIGRPLGVIRAYCSRCGHPLKAQSQGLVCENCNNFERRKLAEDYGKDFA